MSIANLSIVIPTLNEEDYLPKLLESIRKQDFKYYEIIVADAGSDDKTLEIAKYYNCKVIKGGLPAKGRNEGSKMAKGDLLLFLDADVILPDSFFKRTLKEFHERSLDIASFRLIPTPHSRFSRLFMNTFYNQPILLFESILPHAAVGILAKKKVIDKVGGFDENIKLAEDHYLARRAQKEVNAKFGIIRSTKIFVSDRRFRRDGWLKTSIKYLLCELHLIFIGPVKSNIFNYRFNHYKDDNSKPKSQI